MNKLNQYRAQIVPQVINLEIMYEDDKYLPTYANDTDACMDLKIKIRIEKQVNNLTIFSNTDVIQPNESKVFDTGVKMKIPEDYFVQIFPRSSTGFKLNCQLANTVGIIDAGYRDEIKLKLHNFGNEPITLEDGQRIAQFVLLPRPRINLVVVEDNEKFNEGNRGGGIGSTGQ